MARLLVIDGSDLTLWLIGHLAPDGVEIESAKSIHKANTALEHQKPDAVVFGLGPRRAQIEQLARTCRQNRPPIPYLCLHCLQTEASEVDELLCQDDEVLTEHAVVKELRLQLSTLFDKNRVVD